MKEILIDIAKDAGKLLLDNFGNREMSQILQQKEGIDYSIKMDKMVEDRIIGNLKKNGIKGIVISEEIGKVDLGEGDYKIFVDPLDGTLNYSRGIPFFCTSIGVQKNNEMVYGVVYYPFGDELFFAEKKPRKPGKGDKK